MSETSILPGSAPAPDAGIGSPPPLDEGQGPAGGDRRRLIMIVGAGAGVVVLAIVAFLLLHKGSSSTPTTAAPGVIQTTAPTGTTPAGSKGHKGGTTLPKVQKQPSVHNPFVPLIEPPVANAGAPVSSTTVTNATPSANPSPSSTVLTGPGSTLPTSPTVIQSSAPPVSGNTPVSIELMKINGTSSAVFDVFYPGHKYRRYTVQAPKPGATTGTVFDTEFALMFITGDVVTIQVGDGSPFNLQTGIAHKV